MTILIQYRNLESKEAIVTALKKEVKFFILSSSFYTIVCTIILLLCQAEVLLGSPMTYSLFEYAKENADDLVIVTESQPQEQEQV